MEIKSIKTQINNYPNNTLENNKTNNKIENLDLSINNNSYQEQEEKREFYKIKTNQSEQNIPEMQNVQNQKPYTTPIQTQLNTQNNQPIQNNTNNEKTIYPFSDLFGTTNQPQNNTQQAVPISEPVQKVDYKKTIYENEYSNMILDENGRFVKKS